MSELLDKLPQGYMGYLLVGLAVLVVMGIIYFLVSSLGGSGFGTLLTQRPLPKLTR